MNTFLIDSISAITAEMAGHIVVTGSHGGVSAAHLALAHPPALVVFNDAGRGLDDAGVAGLAILETAGVAACAVSHLTARIGEAESTKTTGCISAYNAPAARTGIASGQPVTVACEAFIAANRTRSGGHAVIASPQA
ncbi:MAG: hypothetical protein JNL19_03955 [Burkholderiales bacterium]|nr:hypothetical protein [Burkholderiales bacterium]